MSPSTAVLLFSFGPTLLFETAYLWKMIPPAVVLSVAFKRRQIVDLLSCSVNMNVGCSKEEHTSPSGLYTHIHLGANHLCVPDGMLAPGLSGCGAGDGRTSGGGGGEVSRDTDSGIRIAPVPACSFPRRPAVCCSFLDARAICAMPGTFSYPSLTHCPPLAPWLHLPRLLVPVSCPPPPPPLLYFFPFPPKGSRQSS
ncbi:uncharacterized protein V6R79_020587 [Siganus canaliculatus]